MATLRQHYELLSVAIFVVGVLLITIAEAAARLDWTRAFGAGAITLGAIGVGVWVGLGQSARLVALRQRLAGVKQPIGLTILVLTFLPAMLGLVAGLLGLARDPDGTGWVVLTGALVLALLLAATAAAFAIGASAIRSAGPLSDEAGER